MVKALINLSENANRVLNVVKARNRLKDKSEAVELPLRISAAIRRSSIRPFVQLPIYAWSISLPAHSLIGTPPLGR